MCAAPISAGEAAWTPADADWERLQVEAAAAFAAHDLVMAAQSWAAGLRIARTHFEADDPRLATSLTNHALGLRLRGDAVADRLFTDALVAWRAAPAWLARQRLPPRARSSTFHLRLATKHGGAYDANLRRRAEALLHAARDATASLAAGDPARASDHAALQAFRRASCDAMRKVLAATHLLATPGPARAASARPLRTARSPGT